MNYAERFWSLVDKSGECWTWTAAHNGAGYGSYRTKVAHRVAWELEKGEIPNDMQIDHLCRTRDCVNPAHMELVTSRENTLRGNGIAGRLARRTHCNHGHEFTEENTGWSLDGRTQRQRRYCRVCKRESLRRVRAKAKNCSALVEQNELAGSEA